MVQAFSKIPPITPFADAICRIRQETSTIFPVFSRSTYYNAKVSVSAHGTKLKIRTQEHVIPTVLANENSNLERIADLRLENANAAAEVELLKEENHAETNAW